MICHENTLKITCRSEIFQTNIYTFEQNVESEKDFLLLAVINYTSVEIRKIKFCLGGSDLFNFEY